MEAVSSLGWVCSFERPNGSIDCLLWLMTLKPGMTSQKYDICSILESRYVFEGDTRNEFVHQVINPAESKFASTQILVQHRLLW